MKVFIEQLEYEANVKVFVHLFQKVAGFGGAVRQWRTNKAPTEAAAKTQRPNASFFGKTQAGEPKQSSGLFWRGGTLVRGTPVPW